MFVAVPLKSQTVTEILNKVGSRFFMFSYLNVLTALVKAKSSPYQLDVFKIVHTLNTVDVLNTSLRVNTVDKDIQLIDLLCNIPVYRLKMHALVLTKTIRKYNIVIQAELILK